MKSKRKIQITFVALIFVVLSLAVVVALAFALTQQTITTTLNIEYKAEDIDGWVEASYRTSGEFVPLTPVGPNIDGNKLKFESSDTEPAGYFEFPSEKIELTSSSKSIEIKYSYNNTGDKDYIASMSFDKSLTYQNMTVEYGIWDSVNNVIKYSQSRYAVVVPADSTNKSYWIKITVKDVARNASFKGDFNWLLKGCDPLSDDYQSLESLTFIADEEHGTYSASFNGESPLNGMINFPSEINGSAVTKITASSASAEKIAEVAKIYIPSSVTTIESGAFFGYANLIEATFEIATGWTGNPTTNTSALASLSQAAELLRTYEGTLTRA